MDLLQLDESIGSTFIEAGMWLYFCRIFRRILSIESWRKQQTEEGMFTVDVKEGSTGPREIGRALRWVASTTLVFLAYSILRLCFQREFLAAAVIGGFGLVISVSLAAILHLSGTIEDRSPIRIDGFFEHHPKSITRSTQAISQDGRFGQAA